MSPGSDFEYIAMLWFAVFAPTPEMRKLKSGFLLKEILDRFTNKTQSTLSPDRSIWMYFAHDITISNMLSTLGLFEVWNHLHPIFKSSRLKNKFLLLPDPSATLCFMPLFRTVSGWQWRFVCANFLQELHWVKSIGVGYSKLPWLKVSLGFFVRIVQKCVANE